MTQTPSKSQLSKSLDRRIKHLMIRTLEKFEDCFPDIDDTREGQIFKGDIRNAFNDAMRAQRDELRDYDIDYRPLHMGDDNILSVTQTFMKTVQQVEFGLDSKTNAPFVLFQASSKHSKVLEALRAEIGAGVVTDEENLLTLQIVGIRDCVNCVLPILDRYRLHGKVAPDYKIWREAVVNFYRRQV